MKSLEKVLTKASIAHRSLNMLLVTEAIFFNTGEICPLPEICLLKDKYGFTLLVDESLSFGVLGSTGRGLSEHYTELPGGCCSGGIKCKDAPHKPLADIMVGSLEYAAAAMGGFCCGATRFVGTQVYPHVLLFNLYSHSQELPIASVQPCHHLCAQQR